MDRARGTAVKMLRQYLSLSATAAGNGEKSRVQELFERAAQFRTMARDILAMADEAEAEAMSMVGATHDQAPSKAECNASTRSRFVDTVKYHYAIRRMREQHFCKRIFGEPGWDILLELYAAELTDQKVSTSNLILSSSAPNSTALRWIKNLEDSGLIFKTPSHIDGRVQYQRITSAGYEKMTKYFEDISS